MPSLYQMFAFFTEQAHRMPSASATESAPRQSFDVVTLLRRLWGRSRANATPCDTYMRRDVGLPPLDDRGLPR
jgi:hypothetical protein